jgi:hypothetical protein
MKTIQIKSFQHFVEVLSNDEYSCGHMIYRGVKDINHKLIPSVGLLKEFKKKPLRDLVEHEKQILSLFRHRAYGELTKIPSNDWVWLALAQHHGLPTRLLDWTHSPLIAAFFATEQFVNPDRSLTHICEEGCAIYAAHDCDYIDAFSATKDPFATKESRLVYSPVVTNRIAGQGGLFTIHSDPRKEFQIDFEGKGENNPRWIHKFTFSAITAKEIQRVLFFLGIRKGNIFPDLDGFSSDIKFRFAIGECHMPG